MGQLALRGGTPISPGQSPQAVIQEDRAGRFYPAITKIIPFTLTVASAGTPATLWMPAAGTRFKILALVASPSATDTITFRSPASVTFQLTVKGLANTNLPFPDFRFGLACPSLNTALLVDAGAAATVITGTIFGEEQAS